MYLSRVDIADWRAFEHARLDLPPSGLVALVGPNNAGKTALLTVLYLLATGFCGEGPWLRVGAAEARIEATFVLTERDRTELFFESDGATDWVGTQALASVTFCLNVNQRAEALLTRIASIDEAGRDIEIGRFEMTGPNDFRNEYLNFRMLGPALPRHGWIQERERSFSNSPVWPIGAIAGC